jgi:formate dehydrogenase gamma subunit
LVAGALSKTAAIKLISRFSGIYSSSEILFKLVTLLAFTFITSSMYYSYVTKVGLALVVLGLVNVTIAATEPIKNKTCLECHEDKTLVKTNAAGRAISLFVDEAKFKASRHGTNLCAGCHTDIKTTHPDDNAAAKPVDCAICHQTQSETYGASVHAIALKAGEANAATCKDCHGSHEILPPTAFGSPLHYTKLSATCGECHEEAAAAVQRSVHGKAMAKGHREAATCTDCHFEHKIQKLRGESSLRISGEVCSKCHGSERLNTKYKMPGKAVQTFFESYHGLAASYGSTKAANCASCHGVHEILPHTDPRSSIYKTNLVATCGKCHAGANENFISSKVHQDGAFDKDLGSRVNWWVRKLYIGLIISVIGVMLIHNLVVWFKKVQAMRRSTGEWVERMNRSQRYQHFALVVSFFALAITGFALKFPYSWVSWMLGSDETVRRNIHRYVGLFMVLLGLYHIFYLLFTKDGKQLLRDLLPCKKDITDTLGSVNYLLGRVPEKPRIGRFGYVEKAEYWAMVWGTIIMGATGFMMWFQVDVTRFMLRWVVEVATTIHYYEAILACLAIIVWHFYHVIFDPSSYPGNWAFWDGKMSAEHYREEHPLDDKAVVIKTESTGLNHKKH